MTIHIALLGLRQAGASLALALKQHGSVQVTGHDSQPDPAGRNALGRLAPSPAQAVANADLVVLALPLDEQREMLRGIGPKVRAGGVIVSLTPLLQPPLEWAADLPAERYFVAAHPTLNPDLLPASPAEPRPDLFTRGLWALAPAKGCAPEAVQLASDLAALLGATSYFIDPGEHDGLMGGAEALPVLFSWALMQSAVNSAGWRDFRKMADARFARATALLDEAERLPVLLDRPQALNALDRALTELQSLRAKLAAAEAGELDRALEAMAVRRAKWLAEKRRADWQEQEPMPANVPTVGAMLGHMFAGNLFAKKAGDEKKSE